MASGGARARSGPAPDPNALRRNRDEGDWITLPAAGRRGKPPAWPLSKANARENQLWAEEWKRPQAVQWKKNRQELEVALYVRSVVAAEKRNAPANARVLVARQQEALGISMPGLARNRWRIEDKTTTSTAGASSGDEHKGARDRFRVVKGGKS